MPFSHFSRMLSDIARQTSQNDATSVANQESTSGFAVALDKPTPVMDTEKDWEVIPGHKEDEFVSVEKQDTHRPMTPPGPIDPALRCINPASVAPAVAAERDRAWMMWEDQERADRLLDKQSYQHKYDLAALWSSAHVRATLDGVEKLLADSSLLPTTVDGFESVKSSLRPTTVDGL